MGRKLVGWDIDLRMRNFHYSILCGMKERNQKEKENDRDENGQMKWTTTNQWTRIED